MKKYIKKIKLYKEKKTYSHCLSSQGQQTRFKVSENESSSSVLYV